MCMCVCVCVCVCVCEGERERETVCGSSVVSLRDGVWVISGVCVGRARVCVRDRQTDRD